MPVHFDLAGRDVRAQGVIVEIEETTGRALSIKRVEYRQDDK
jgi:calcineurin-like phosphoesterase